MSFGSHSSREHSDSLPFAALEPLFFFSPTPTSIPETETPPALRKKHPSPTLHTSPTSIENPPQGSGPPRNNTSPSFFTLSLPSQQPSRMQRSAQPPARTTQQRLVTLSAGERRGRNDESIQADNPSSHSSPSFRPHERAFECALGGVSMRATQRERIREKISQAWIQVMPKHTLLVLAH